MNSVAFYRFCCFLPGHQTIYGQEYTFIFHLPIISVHSSVHFFKNVLLCMRIGKGYGRVRNESGFKQRFVDSVT